MTEYKILQTVKNVVKIKHEVVYTGKIKRIARKEYPTEHFELVQVNHKELCLDYSNPVILKRW
jgi:hypothetical protein